MKFEKQGETFQEHYAPDPWRKWRIGFWLFSGVMLALVVWAASPGFQNFDSTFAQNENTGYMHVMGGFNTATTNLLTVNTNILFISGAGTTGATNINQQYNFNVLSNYYIGAVNGASIQQTGANWQLFGTDGNWLYTAIAEATHPTLSSGDFPLTWSVHHGAAPAPTGYFTNQSSAFNVYIQQTNNPNQSPTLISGGLSTININSGLSNTIYSLAYPTNFWWTGLLPGSTISGFNINDYGWGNVVLGGSSLNLYGSGGTFANCGNITAYYGSDTFVGGSENGIISNAVGVSVTLAVNGFTNYGGNDTLMLSGGSLLMDNGSVNYVMGGQNVYGNVNGGFTFGLNQTNNGTKIYDIGDWNTINQNNTGSYFFGESNILGLLNNHIVVVGGGLNVGSFAGSTYVGRGNNNYMEFLSTSAGTYYGPNFTFSNNVTISNTGIMYQLAGDTNYTLPTVVTNVGWVSGAHAYFTNGVPSDMRGHIAITGNNGTITNWCTVTYGHVLSNIPCVFVTGVGANIESAIFSTGGLYISTNTTSGFTISTGSFTSSSVTYFIDYFVVQ